MLAAVWTVVLVAASDRAEAPAEVDDRPLGPVRRAEPSLGIEAVELTLALESGRTVPEVVGAHDHADHDRPGDRGDHSPSAEPRLEVGDATTGATIVIGSGLSSLVIHPAGDVRLAVRIDGPGAPATWTELATNRDEAPDSEAGDGPGPALGPIWLGDDTRSVDLVVLAGVVSELTVTLLGTTDGFGADDGSGLGTIGSARVTDRLDQPPAGPVVAAVDEPSINGRALWTEADWAYDNDHCEDGPEVADNLAAAVFHHTVTANGYDRGDVDDLLRAIHYSHVRINGWCDIGYNFVVDRFGTVWEGRSGSLNDPVIGGHAKGFNTSTVGIALLGQHNSASRPAAASPSTGAIDAASHVARWKLEPYGVDPSGRTWLKNRSSSGSHRLDPGQWHLVPTILNHRDLGLTSCPGDLGVTALGPVVAGLTADRDVSVPYRFPARSPADRGPGFVVVDRRAGLRSAGSAAVVGGPSESTDDPVVAVGGNHDGGYLLTVGGQLLTYGSAPEIGGRPAADGQPVDLVVRSDGRSGWILDAGGRLYGFGGTAGAQASITAAGRAVAADLDDDGSGYVLDAAGRLHPIGGAPPAPRPGSDMGAPADVTLASDGPAGRAWVVDGSGSVVGYGGAASFRPEDLIGGEHLSPLGAVAVVPSDNGAGGWVVDVTGQLFAFGRARPVIDVSTDTVGGSVVDAAQVGHRITDSFRDGDDARYVTELYRLFLGREPGPLELDWDATGLDFGSGRTSITTRLAQSDGWAGRAVDQMYRDVLGRPADADGRAYWVERLADGMELSDVGVHFYGSDEYVATSGSEAAFVTNLYGALLGRAPDDRGLAFWVDLLATDRAGPDDVADGFYRSVESRRARVNGLYRQILDREPDQGGREYWAERLLEVDDVELAAQLAGSVEYYDRVTDGKG